jgi:hypothetical protein
MSKKDIGQQQGNTKKKQKKKNCLLLGTPARVLSAVSCALAG